VRQINSSECNHSGHSDGGGSRSGKAEGGVDTVVVAVGFVVVAVGFFVVINTERIVRIAGLFIVVVRLLTVFVTLFTLFVRLLFFTVLILSLTLSIFVRLLLFLFLFLRFGAVVDISGAFGFIFEDIAREFGNRIGVVVLVDGDVGNLVSCLDNSVVTSVGICTSKHS